MFSTIKMARTCKIPRTRFPSLTPGYVYAIADTDSELFGHLVVRLGRQIGDLTDPSNRWSIDSFDHKVRPLCDHDRLHPVPIE